MDTNNEDTTTRVIYITNKPQRLQIDGKVSWYPAGKEIDPKWIHPTQLKRMVRLGFLVQKEVTESVEKPKPKVTKPVAPVPPVERPK